jgi:hypothetical protein
MLVRVRDASTKRPVASATVIAHKRHYMEIPPPQDREGITNANGEVILLTPSWNSIEFRVSALGEIVVESVGRQRYTRGTGWLTPVREDGTSQDRVEVEIEQIAR